MGLETLFGRFFDDFFGCLDPFTVLLVTVLRSTAFLTLDLLGSFEWCNFG